MGQIMLQNPKNGPNLGLDPMAQNPENVTNHGLEPRKWAKPGPEPRKWTTRSVDGRTDISGYLLR